MNIRITNYRLILSALLIYTGLLMTSNSFAGILTTSYATKTELTDEVRKLNAARASESASQQAAIKALQDKIKSLASCANFKAYKIGAIGPAGGKVFYISADGLHGLEAAPADQGIDIAWGENKNITTYAKRMGINAGSINTQLIINKQGEKTYAAQVSANYHGGKYGDWYLPSLTELEMLIKQKDVVGGLNNYGYWSSTEVDGVEAWMGWVGGGAGNALKSEKLGVRAIRAF